MGYGPVWISLVISYYASWAPEFPHNLASTHELSGKPSVKIFNSQYRHDQLKYCTIGGYCNKYNKSALNSLEFDCL